MIQSNLFHVFKDISRDGPQGLHQMPKESMAQERLRPLLKGAQMLRPLFRGRHTSLWSRAGQERLLSGDNEPAEQECTV